jgi:hypothetical protein
VAAYKKYTSQDGDTWWNQDQIAWTGETGAYDIGGLAPGTYRIGFDPDSSTGLAREYYDDQLVVEGAKDITVSAASPATGIDARLAPASRVTGTVTDASGAPMAGVEVAAHVGVGGDWGYASWTTTAADGTYSLDGLAEGTYRVDFWAEAGDDWLYEAWNDKGSLEEGDDIAVGTDVTVTGKDAQIVAGEHDPDPFTLLAAPVISGTQQVGNTLTVSTGTWTPTPATTEIYWFRGEEYTGVSGPTYALTDADAGQVLTVLVQVYGPDGQYEYANATTGAIAAAPVPAVTPTAPVVTPPAPVVTPPATAITFPTSMDVKGSLKVGSTLKLKKYKATDSGATVSYTFQWYAGSKKIKKATKAKLRVTKALKGKKIAVKVTARSGTTAKTVKVKVGKIR